MNRHAALLVAAMALGTVILRGLPFLLFQKRTPPLISYLGRVLPPAIIGLLVIYCLKDVSFRTAPFGLPEILAAYLVIGLQVWKRNSLLSILSGTAVYMLMLQLVF